MIAPQLYIFGVGEWLPQVSKPGNSRHFVLRYVLGRRTKIEREFAALAAAPGLTWQVGPPAYGKLLLGGTLRTVLVLPKPCDLPGLERTLAAAATIGQRV